MLHLPGSTGIPSDIRYAIKCLHCMQIRTVELRRHVCLCTTNRMVPQFVNVSVFMKCFLPYNTYEIT